MKAAVLHAVGMTPTYEEFPDPTPGEGEVLITVKAVALENIDKAIAAGTHYSSKEFISTLPTVVGFDGVGTLEDGTLVGFGGTKSPYGAMAEKTVVPKANIVPVPEGIDPATAVVLASALTGFSMKYAAGFKPGETVLIQGVTGVAGRLAAKVAKLLGAKRIVGTGRDQAASAELKRLGVDMIDTTVADDKLIQAFKDKGPFDVVLDFLWGRPTELLIASLTPDELSFAKPTRLVQIGSAAGNELKLAAEGVRTSGLEIYGSGKGLSGEVMSEAYAQVVEWAREKKLTFDIERIPLKDIESAWQRTDFRGKRLVIIP